jgi:hypothetical protein
VDARTLGPVARLPARRWSAVPAAGERTALAERVTRIGWRRGDGGDALLER